MFHIDPKSQTPLYLQLYRQLKNEINTHYKIGEKLPSIRALSVQYNLSKTTVQSAYSQLYAEGYIESRPKRGYFVSAHHFEDFKASTTQETKPQKSLTYRYDFFPAQLTKESFPLKIWKRIFHKAIDESVDFGAYHDGKGDVLLREEICRYLRASRGVNCRAEQIVVCSGFSDAMGLVAKLLRERYQHFGMESPGYHVARRVFEEYGYEVEKIAVGKEGLEVKALASSTAQIVYITPSHQYPTGVSMPISRRLELLSFIAKTGGLILEDDYDSELSYANRPIPSLQGLDYHDRVVYLGTFAKALSPALRVAYMVLPEHLLPCFDASYDAHFPRVSLTTQKTLALFLKEGHWDRHLRKIRTLNHKKHDLMLKTLQKSLKSSMKVLSKGGGLAILIYPTVKFDFEKLKTLAEQKGIKIYFAKERCGGEFEAIRMGFGGFGLDEIQEAVEAFSEIWWESCLL